VERSVNRLRDEEAVPVDVVYASFRGHFSDNPRAIYEGLVARGTEATHTWLTADHPRPTWPSGVATVPFGSQGIAALEAADLIVGNDCISSRWTKKPGAVYLQTWHGTPLKRIHHDVPSRRQLWAAADRDVERWDLLLAQNLISTEVLRQAFGFRGAVRATGYPRNDQLSGPGRDRVRAAVRAALGIGEGTTAVLYAPTWRDDLVLDGAGARDFEFPLDLEDVTARLGRDHVLLLRLHHMVRDRLDVPPSSAVRDVSDHPDIGELYLAADVMVTDYSSAMFDWAVTGKPLLHYAYDLDRYRDQQRGLYFDLAEVAPGPLLSTSTEVVDAIVEVDTFAAATADRYRRFRETFCHLDDGDATGRVLDLLADAGIPVGAAPSPTARPSRETPREP
jgi:CDP-glycerol glycerophosphotransferase (TagB/SpsB family)